MSKQFTPGAGVGEMVFPSSDFRFGTLLMVVKLTAVQAWYSLIEFETAGGVLQGAFLRHNGGNLCFNNGSGNLTAVAFAAADGWCVIATAKATGTVAANNYKIPIGGATTTAATDTGANMFTSAVMRLGGDDDFAPMLVAAVAVFNGVVLSQAQIEGVAAALTTQSIADLTPTRLYDDSDGLATNLMDPGTGDRASQTGITDSADDPAGWVYGLGGGTVDATVTAVPAFGTGDLPTPTAAAGATVTAPAADAAGTLPIAANEISSEVAAAAATGTGDLPAPTVSADANADVEAVPAGGTGDLPPPGVAADAEVVSPAADGVAGLPAPAVSATGAGTVEAVPADATGELPAPVIATAATVLASVGAGRVRGPRTGRVVRARRGRAIKTGVRL